jgi:hypothetical protein
MCVAMARLQPLPPESRPEHKSQLNVHPGIWGFSHCIGWTMRRRPKREPSYAPPNGAGMGLRGEAQKCALHNRWNDTLATPMEAPPCELALQTFQHQGGRAPRHGVS